MHEDYQLAYCPLAHITSLAFADDAFENARLTPELLHKLRVPGRLHVLPAQIVESLWRKEAEMSLVPSVDGLLSSVTGLLIVVSVGLFSVRCKGGCPNGG